MGVVYRASDTQTGREVALKVALSAMNPRQIARFEREGELTARLSHSGNGEALAADLDAWLEGRWTSRAQRTPLLVL
jgi:serine/threonine protein kinase